VTRQQRLMASIRGEPVDRPPVSFYEIGGWRVDPDDPNPYNVYNDPSWRPLIELAEETDMIWMCGPTPTPISDRYDEFFKTEVTEEGNRQLTRITCQVGGRTMTLRMRRDAEVNTTWRLEHLLKDADDLKAYLELPDEIFMNDWDVSNLIQKDKEIGDRGVVSVDTADPICMAADLFSMEDYTVMAFTERELFHKLLEKVAKPIYRKVEQVAREFPGHLWRICGPEYATEPYLPPSLFEEYVVRYTKPMVDTIRKYGGFPRIHCHGRIKSALPYFVEMGGTGTDPIEPPTQGDVELDWVRREFGKDLTLFGNIEVSEIENMPPPEFEKRVAKALRDGTAGQGRGFVLMPTACPYGRTITDTTMANYETMLRLATSFTM
jgi:uroporphyrinogen-III decarboxylase